MLSPGDLMIQKGLEEKVFNTHVSLVTAPENIISEVEGLLELQDLST